MENVPPWVVLNVQILELRLLIFSVVRGWAI